MVGTRRTVVSIGGIGAALLSVLGWLGATMYSELSHLRDQVSAVSERIARIEARAGRIADYTEWRDGATAKTAELKDD